MDAKLRCVTTCTCTMYMYGFRDSDAHAVADMDPVADPEGFHRFPLKPPLVDNVIILILHLCVRESGRSREAIRPELKNISFSSSLDLDHT